MSEVPVIAAIDEVCTFFEETVEALVPSWEPGRRFHLLGEDSGRLQDQPKNAGFFRQFDVRFAMDGQTGTSYLPLERGGTLLIQIGYLGSVKSRRLSKIVRQDEELIARTLLSADLASPSNRPFNWDFVPPVQSEELGFDLAATVITLVYEVHYVCDAV